jgi:ABC-type transport system involved in Fe-S cluster assembly fused permease/ATPase subunit
MSTSPETIIPLPSNIAVLAGALSKESSSESERRSGRELERAIERGIQGIGSFAKVTLFNGVYPLIASGGTFTMVVKVHSTSRR